MAEFPVDGITDDGLAAHVADARRVLYDPAMRGKTVAASTVRGLLAGLRVVREERDALRADLAGVRLANETLAVARDRLQAQLASIRELCDAAERGQKWIQASGRPGPVIVDVSSVRAILGSSVGDVEVQPTPDALHRLKAALGTWKPGVSGQGDNTWAAP